MTVVAEVVRNGFVESVHHGVVVGLAATGDVAVSVGDVEAAVMPRSALKPLQAVGMVRLGLAVPADELAIICASHSGEAGHVAVVERLLALAGLEVSDLQNTPGMPVDGATRRELTRMGSRPDSLHQNCSGKHAGMLATCVVAGWSIADYRSPTHPLQVALADTVADLCGEPVSATAVDGCGAPAFAVSLLGLARGVAALAKATMSMPEGQVAAAMRANAWLVGGTGRDVTTLIDGVPGLVAKDGAEGVYVAGMPDGRAVAVKVSDGAARARMPVLVAALRGLGVEAPAFADLATTPVLGHGEPVGEVHVVPF